jgi:hypothetical protein
MALTAARELAVGRPDRRASLGWSAEQLGALLYDSLHVKLLELPGVTRGARSSSQGSGESLRAAVAVGGRNM